MTNFKSVWGSSDQKPSQLQIAEAFVHHVGKENLVMDKQGDFWQWANGRWAIVNKHAFQNEVLKFLNGSVQLSANWLKSVYELIGVLTSRNDVSFNMDKSDIVNMINGELELDAAQGKWSLSPHDLNRYCTIQLPLTYDPQAEAPRFLRYLQECFHCDDDIENKRTSLLEMIGYSLVNHAKHERFVLLVGNGANGKSVLLKLLRSICGLANVSAVQVSSLGRTFQRETLNRSLVNIVTEINEDEVIDYAALKSIVSGEVSTVEAKNQAPYVGEPSSTLWLASNHLPKFNDKSDGLKRRALIIQFNHTIPVDKRDPNLFEKLQLELPGILNLALNAYANAISQGFTTPESTSDIFRAINRKSDQVKAFVDEMVIEAQGEVVQSRVAFDAYMQWANNLGLDTSISIHAFIKRLNKLGFESYRTSSCRFVKGMILPYSHLDQARDSIN
ncbi:hypothetical protein BM528_08100 [Alteromonas sp. RW2A1]|uniref:DNA primase family protein n=1 Tax=Alteromonas sp. RW2A1 TaxID=1917158 RepID=UPI000903E0CA|nr:phage/plasmid primase, P4 family [Alteromonas sp. RW2A1]APE05737.1 hypothetical protein BM528_08100 [Alteromonas sp. RW2A1]